MKIVQVVVVESEVANSFTSYNDLPIKSNTNCNILGKELIVRLTDCKTLKKECEFGFHFRGAESFNYLKNFQNLIKMLLDKVKNQSSVNKLMQVLFESMNLCRLVSYSVPIDDIDKEGINKMHEYGTLLLQKHQ